MYYNKPPVPLTHAGAHACTTTSCCSGARLTHGRATQQEALRRQLEAAKLENERTKKARRRDAEEKVSKALWLPSMAK